MNKQAGIDLSTGHAVDSFFNPQNPKDPWAERCVVTFIDTLINYKEVSYAYPSCLARKALTGLGVPKCFLKATKRGLLKAIEETTADDIIISEEEVKRQHGAFVGWASIHIDELIEWLTFYETTEGMKFNIATDATELDRYAKAYWGRIDHDLFPATTGLYGDGLVFAFQSFLRAVQYQQIFGTESDYYAHPIREVAYRAIESQSAGNVSNQAIYRWSWGQYFLCYLKRENRMPEALDLDRLMNRVRSVRKMTHEAGAAWYQQPTEITDEAIKNIAVAAKLPARLDERWRRAARRIVGVAGVVKDIIDVFDPADPVVKIMLSAASAAVTEIAEVWDGTVPQNIQRIEAIRGHLEWQGLFDEC